MDAKNAEAFAVRIGNLAESLVAGVLRALATRKSAAAGGSWGTIGGCTPIGDDAATSGVLRVSVTFTGTAEKA